MNTKITTDGLGLLNSARGDNSTKGERISGLGGLLIHHNNNHGSHDRLLSNNELQQNSFITKNNKMCELVDFNKT